MISSTLCNIHRIGPGVCCFMGKSNHFTSVESVSQIAKALYQYFKMVRNEGLERSYNAEISTAGQKELFNDVYRDYQSTSSTTDVSSTLDEFTDIHTDPSKV
jgi:hypothetical protein